jgi:hypothetical protein
MTCMVRRYLSRLMRNLRAGLSIFCIIFGVRDGALFLRQSSDCSSWYAFAILSHENLYASVHLINTGECKCFTCRRDNRALLGHSIVRTSNGILGLILLWNHLASPAHRFVALAEAFNIA